MIMTMMRMIALAKFITFCHKYFNVICLTDNFREKWASLLNRLKKKFTENMTWIFNILHFSEIAYVSWEYSKITFSITSIKVQRVFCISCTISCLIKNFIFWSTFNIFQQEKATWDFSFLLLKVCFEWRPKITCEIKEKPPESNYFVRSRLSCWCCYNYVTHFHYWAIFIHGFSIWKIEHSNKLFRGNSRVSQQKKISKRNCLIKKIISRYFKIW